MASEDSDQIVPGFLTVHRLSDLGNLEKARRRNVSPVFHELYARRELLERMACFAFATAVLITGPMLHDCRAPDSVEEAWILERAYGPPQRWVLDIVSKRSLEKTPVDSGETLQIQDVSGIRVAVLSSKDVPHLAIDLRGDSLRVLEIDA